MLTTDQEVVSVRETASGKSNVVSDKKTKIFYKLFLDKLLLNEKWEETYGSSF